ncbi:MAG: hypothetical protein C0424_00290 [Sphingobacteriaceae bacterium]|nr:hypothetical protein [Sphingobacteriaceae bacterium]
MQQLLANRAQSHAAARQDAIFTLNMRLRFLYNAGVVVLLNLTVKPLWIFAIDRQVQNQAGPEAYGSYYALLNFSLLLGALLDAGMSNFNARRVAMQQGGQQFDISSLLGLKSLLFVVYLALNLVFAAFTSTSISALFLLILLNQGIHFLNLFLRSYLAGLQQFKTEGFFGVLDKLLMSLLALPLLFRHAYLSGDLMTDFVLIQTLAYATTSLLLFARLRPYAHIQWRFSQRQNLYWLKQSYPFAVLGILMAGYTKLDAVLLGKLASDGDLAVGIYAAGYRLLDAVAMVPILVSGMLLPQFAAMLANRQLDAAFVRTVALLLGGLGSLVAGVSHFQAYWMMDWLYAHQAAEQSEVFVILMWSFLPLSLNYVFGTLLTAGGQLKWLNGFAAAALLLNIGMNVLLIPQHGALGAAWSTLLTQSFVALAQLITAWRMHRWKPSAGFVARIGLWLGVLWALSIHWPMEAGFYSSLLQGVTGLALLLLIFGQPLYTRISALAKGRFS